jgi:PTS system nitrogen regulatory IIA component
VLALTGRSPAEPIKFLSRAASCAPIWCSMNDLSDLLTIDRVDAGLSVANKKALFQQLGILSGRKLGIEAKTIVTALAEREKNGSTGYGGGVAIPHGRIEGLGGEFGLFVRLSQPIDFQSVDGLPVDLVFLLLSAPDAGAAHLKALASVSRTLRDRETVAKLRGARSRDAIFALLVGIETLNAA